MLRYSKAHRAETHLLVGLPATLLARRAAVEGGVARGAVQQLLLSLRRPAEAALPRHCRVMLGGLPGHDRSGAGRVGYAGEDAICVGGRVSLLLTIKLII